MEVISWLKDNYQNVLMAGAALVAAAEVIVRLTPTEKDDGAVERIGGILRKVMDFLKVPNMKK